MAENGLVEVECSSFQDALATQFAVFVDSAPIEAGGVGAYIRGNEDTVVLQEKSEMASAMTGSIDHLNSTGTTDGKDFSVGKPASDIEGIDGASATDKQLIEELVQQAGADLQGCFARTPLFNEPGSVGMGPYRNIKRLADGGGATCVVGVGMSNDDPADVSGVFAGLFQLGEDPGETTWHSGIDEGEAGYEATRRVRAWYDILDEEGVDETEV